MVVSLMYVPGMHFATGLQKLWPAFAWKYADGQLLHKTPAMALYLPEGHSLHALVASGWYMPGTHDSQYD